MNFSELDVTRRTRKGNFLNPIDQLIDWTAIEKAIARHYAPVSDAAGRSVCPGLLLFKMLFAGILHGGLSDEAVEDMANSNLYVMRFLGLYLKDDVSERAALSRFRTRLTAAGAWDELLAIINEQIQPHGVMVTQSCHVDARASRTVNASLRASRSMKVVSDREDRDDEVDVQAAMRVIEVTQPGMDTKYVESKRVASQSLVTSNIP